MSQKNLSIQGDRGVEFVGPANATSTSPFVRLLEQGYGISHCTIPPTNLLFNGSVGNSHGRIQDELDEIESMTAEKSKDLIEAFLIPIKTQSHLSNSSTPNGQRLFLLLWLFYHPSSWTNDLVLLNNASMRSSIQKQGGTFPITSIWTKVSGEIVYSLSFV